MMITQLCDGWELVNPDALSAESLSAGSARLLPRRATSNYSRVATLERAGHEGPS
ncbi:MAG: hypothetical protein M1420_00830 [Actinobacteria bacterium]|jgi:hypothetical protein|nr:hypothetical protein [Actinomycetota bacterium]